MTRKTLKVLSVLLSTLMAFSCFAVVPGFALDTGKIENVVLSDKDAEGTPASFAELANNLNVSSKYDGTSLKLYGIDNAYLKNQLSGRAEEQQLSSLKWKAWVDKDNQNYTTVATSYISAITDLSMYSDNANGTNYKDGDTSLLTKKGYDATVTTGTVYGSDRIAADCYDVLMVAGLKTETKIDTFFLSTHPNANLSFATYKVYVSNDEDTLFLDENEVLMYDNYTNCKANQKFNSMASRTSEVNYWTFDGEKPTGKFVGIKLYDAAVSMSSFFNFYELGIYGQSAAATLTGAVAKVTSSSQKNTVMPGKATVTALDANGDSVLDLVNGQEYTFTTAAYDEDHITFDGWFAATDKNFENCLSKDRSYKTVYNGTTLVAKYSTDAILNVNAEMMADGSLAMVHNFSSTGKALDYTYDSDERAMTITGTDKTTNGSLISTFAYNGTTIFSTGFEPWTTYKMTVRAKVSGSDTPVYMAPNGLTLGVQRTITQDYTDLTVYFNSGAADYTRDAQTFQSAVSTSHLSSNFFNLNLAKDNRLFIKSILLEKVNNVAVISDKNATVEVASGALDFAKGYANTAITNDGTVYGGEKNADAVGAWVKAQMGSYAIVAAAADGETVRFTVTPKEGFAATVTANGEVLSPVEENTYEFTANGEEADTGNFASDLVKIQVVTKELITHSVKFYDKMGNLLKEIAVNDGEKISDADLEAINALVPDIYGYEKLLSDGKQAWDGDVTEAVQSDVSFVAQYTVSNKTYAVSYKKVDGTVVDLGALKFDTRIVCTDENAKSFTVNGQVVASGKEAVLYVYGAFQVIAESSEATDNSIGIMESFKGTKDGLNTLITFVRVNNPENKKIADVGVIFASANAATAMADLEWTQENFTDAGFKCVIAHSDKNGAQNFMGRLVGIKDGASRAARAYVAFEDGTRLYSNTVTVSY